MMLCGEGQCLVMAAHVQRAGCSAAAAPPPCVSCLTQLLRLSAESSTPTRWRSTWNAQQPRLGASQAPSWAGPSWLLGSKVHWPGGITAGLGFRGLGSRGGWVRGRAARLPGRLPSMGYELPVLSALHLLPFSLAPLCRKANLPVLTSQPSLPFPLAPYSGRRSCPCWLHTPLRHFFPACPAPPQFVLAAQHPRHFSLRLPPPRSQEDEAARAGCIAPTFSSACSRPAPRKTKLPVMDQIRVVSQIKIARAMGFMAHETRLEKQHLRSVREAELRQAQEQGIL